MMIPRRLDKMQHQLAKAMEKHRGVVLLGEKDSGKSHVLRWVAAAKLFQGKKVLIITDDANQAEITRRWMKSYRLGEETIILDFSGDLPASVLNKLSETLKQKGSGGKSVDKALFLVDYNRLESAIERFYRSINAPLLDGKPWQEWVVLSGFDQSQVSLAHLNQSIDPRKFSFDQAEYESLYGQLELARDFFEKGQAFTERFFTPRNYTLATAEDAWKELSGWVSQVKKRVINLILVIDQYLQDRGRQYEEEFLAECREHKNQLDQRRKELQISQIIASGLTQTGKGPSILRALAGSKSKSEELERERTKEVFLTSLYAVRRVMGDFLPDDQWNILQAESENGVLEANDPLYEKLYNQLASAAESYLFRKLESIHFNVSSDPVLSRMDNEMQGLFDFVNNQDFFQLHFENTGFSLVKQLRQLEGLLGEMNRIQSLAGHFKKYFEWNAYFHKAGPQIQYLVEKILLIQPNNWVSFFRDWYVQNWIRKNRIVFDEHLGDLLAELHLMAGKGPDIFYEAFIGERNARLKDLPDHSRSQFRAIVQKKQIGGADLNRLLMDSFDWFATVYPLMILPLDKLNEIPENMPSGWDLILADLKGPVSKDVLHWLKSQTDEECHLIASTDQEELMDSGLNELAHGGFPVYRLNGIHQQSLIDLTEMNHTERLYAARNLAHLLEDINPHIVVFHLGNKILFSCMSEPLNEVLGQWLDDKGIKRMRVLESAFHLLVENLLELDTEKLLITQDHLINNQSIGNPDWQLFVLDRISKAGIRTFNLNTTSLHSNAMQYMIQFIEQILESGPEK